MNLHFPHIRKFFNGALIGFIFALLFSIFSSINTIIYINKMHGDLQEMYGMDKIGQNSVQTARIDLVFLDSEMKNLMLAKNQTEISEAELEIGKYQKDFLAQIGRAEKNYKLKKSGPLFKKVRELSGNYFRIVAAAHSLKVTGTTLFTEDLTIAKTRRLLQSIDEILNKLDDIKQIKDLRIYQNLIREHEISINILLFLAIATLITRVIMFTNDPKNRKPKTREAEAR